MSTNELSLDRNARQNLATFCTTWMEPDVRQLTLDRAVKNMIDKDEADRANLVCAWPR